MDEQRSDLAGLLRRFRDRLAPVDAGLRTSTRRRATGLRREELADLAGLSVDYVVRLEQGRALNPSRQVVAALARALQVDRAERDLLHRAAGLLPPADGRVGTHVPPGVARLVARLGEAPVAVFSADWHLLSWNELWAALHGDPAAIPPSHRNLVRAVFGDPEVQAHLRPSTSANGTGAFEAALVADLRHAAVAYPDDPGLRSLVADLRRTSTVFADLWDSGAVAAHQSDCKSVQHPDVGDITLDCDVLTVPGADVRVVVYSAATGSPDADKLDFLRVAHGVPPKATASADTGS